MEPTRAILLRRTRFGDTSLILTWFSERNGKVKTIAKGALRPKSLFFGKVDLFFLCDLAFVPAKSGELHSTKEVRLLDPFPGIRSSYTRTLAAGYFSELVENASELEHPHEVVFKLLERGLNHLNEQEPRLRSVTFFEDEICRMIETELGQEAREQSRERRLRALIGRIPETRAALLERVSGPLA